MGPRRALGGFCKRVSDKGLGFRKGRGLGASGIESQHHVLTALHLKPLAPC